MDFKKEITNLLKEQFSLQSITDEYIEIPPDKNLGDYSLPCFKLAKEMKKSPVMISDDFAERMILPSYIKRIESVKGYLNFFVDENKYSQIVIENILNGSDSFGRKGETVLVEYSSPNIAKPFHIGHLCSTIIGDALYRIYDHIGYDVVRLNHVGDYGTQFGKLISAYKRWGSEEALNQDPIAELFRIYVKFHDEAKNDPALEDEGRMYFKRLEDGEREEVAIWQLFRDLSLKKFNEIYKRLEVEFDSYAGESFYSDKMDAAVEELRGKNLLTESEGAMVVDLSEYNMPPCIILKSDGATIYATRDIAAALYRKQEYDFKKSLYVVGIPQELHFRQFIKVLELMGHEWSKDCKHIGFAHVRFKEGKMATRSGQVVLLEDVLNEAVERVKIKMNEGYKKLENMDEAAEKIGIGAIKFAFLKAGREREIVFSWDETLDFNGESGPYVQYTYSRAKSILRKADMQAGKQTGRQTGSLDNINICPEEFDLIKLLNGFNEALEESAARNEPSVVTRYVYTVAKAFNRFYNSCSVVGSEYEFQRLRIVEVTSSVISRCLVLIGIKCLEEM